MDKFDLRKTSNQVSFDKDPPSEEDSSKKEICSSSRASSTLTDLPSDRRLTFKKRASQIILQVPVAHLKRIKQTESVGSFHREAKHFSDITTLHGPKRIFYGKKWSTWFWILITMFAVVMLIYQISSLVSIYASRPTLSQVSFLISEDGLDFPIVTICNFNPIKKSYINKINETGDFSDLLLNYLLQSNADTETLFNSADRADLHIGEAMLQLYQKKHPNFTIPGFFDDAGFDCCKYSKKQLTSLGKCYSLNVRLSEKEWMKKQVSAGVNAGLQLVLDAHLEEQFESGEHAETVPYYASSYENGFRYYVHSLGTIPYLASEGISVSPSSRVYTAIASNRYILLPHKQWGNCSNDWPPGYSTQLPYSTANCEHLCKAKFFNDSCGCSPADLNLDRAFNICTPYQTYQCIDRHVRKQINGTDYFQMPDCRECKVECNSLVYHAYNSYGQGFNSAALRFFHSKNSSWTPAHVKANFMTINVFFRDMSHTEYRQVQATSLTEILSDMGGNMGLFLGMSVFSFAELVLFLSKCSWIVVSKKRRNYMYKKKVSEEEAQKNIEEAVTNMKNMKSRKANGSMRALKAKILALAQNRNFGGSTVSPTSDDVITNQRSKYVDQTKLGRSQTISEAEASKYYRNGSQDSTASMIEFSINLSDLRNQLELGHFPPNVQSSLKNILAENSKNERQRSHSTAGPSTVFFVENED
ncbi:unnamed protein product [Caenorhabditis auriculariae]|uniref:Uncharacterized protein n=1 Tax=Caenorhabditis auriculariae TaxID=2777116 RepID=A0A8S1H361_9PELO|nr:unnamed protein product [Caenorhabditis auriculariae]